jgi:signal peptidase II
MKNTSVQNLSKNNPSNDVIPAQAGIQNNSMNMMDCCLRGNDVGGWFNGSFLTPILFIVLIAIDQCSKFYLIEYLPTIDYKLEVTSFLDFQFAWNYGVSFGLFHNFRTYSNIFFGVFNSCIVFYIFYLMRKAAGNLERYGYLIITAGAVGNLIDRVHSGAVFDFILFHYGKWQFAIFNFADMCVSFGVFLLLLHHLKSIYRD